MAPKGKLVSKQKAASPRLQETPIEQEQQEDVRPTPSIHSKGQFNGLWKKVSAEATFFIHEAECSIEFEDGKRFKFTIKGPNSCGMDILGELHIGSLVAGGTAIEWSNGSSWHKVECHDAATHSLFLLQQGTALTSIDLHGRLVGDGGAWFIADALSNHVNLVEMSISLRRNAIGSRGASRIAVALERTDYLAALDFSCNQINDIGAESVARALKLNSSLRVLDLSNNSITDRGAAKVAGALRVNCTLRTLNLSCNDIGDVGAEQLAIGLEDNSAVTALDLSSNRIQDDGAMKLHSAILESGMLITLDLSSNYLQDDIPEDLSLRPWR